MQIPCVCSSGHHSFTANELVSIVGAFQRGELNSIRYVRGEITGIVPSCIAHADFDTGHDGRFTGPCNVEMPDGSFCQEARGHTKGRHGKAVRK